MNLSPYDVLAIIVVCIAVIAMSHYRRDTLMAEAQADVQNCITKEESRQVQLQCRVENIKNAGWPPEHLDADGDPLTPVSFDDNDFLLLAQGNHPLYPRPQPTTTQGA